MEEQPDTLAATGVSRARRWLVYGLLAGIAGGHLVDIALQREHWPFSNYPMWARASTVWKAGEMRLRGVVADGSGGAGNGAPAAADDEIELRSVHFRPLPSMQLFRALQEVNNPNDARRQDLLRRRAQELLAYYEKLRLAGRHAGPPLRALRVYSLEWDINRAVDNFDRPQVRLAMEVTAPAAAPAQATPAAASVTPTGAAANPAEVR